MRKHVLTNMVVLCLLTASATAGVPQALNYQGQLADQQGAPLSGSYSMVFTIYNAAVDGDAVWTETQATVTVTEGSFSVLLGSVNPISDTVFSGTERYLGITVGGDPEMSPRSELVSSAYSMRVGTVDGASGGVVTSDLFIGEPTTGFSSVAGGKEETNSALTHCVPPSGANLTVTEDLIVDHRATIGQANINLGDFALVVGCQNNITATGDFSTIAGGSHNTVSGSSAAIGGGEHNQATANHATIGGGGYNENHRSYSTIGGGELNKVLGDAHWGTIGGGYSNSVEDSGTTVGGGGYNNVSYMADWGTIGGGYSDSVIGRYGTIGGGQMNFINYDGEWGTIGGGSGNQVGGHATLTAKGATIPGGRDNTASGDYSFAAGRQAKAEHNGTFVWSDNSQGAYQSTADGQFLISAANGVGINLPQAVTFNQGAALDINGQISIRGGGPVAGHVLTTDPLGFAHWAAPTGGSDGDWELGTLLNGDVLFSMGNWGIARSGASLLGTNDFTHVNLGVNSSTGSTADNPQYVTIGGGFQHRAEGEASTISGGYINRAYGHFSAIAGGYENLIGAPRPPATVDSGRMSFIGGGYRNYIEGKGSVIGGGSCDSIFDTHGFIGGGGYNVVGTNDLNISNANYITVSGGFHNTASAHQATIGGGQWNEALGEATTIAGGAENTAIAPWSCIGGGENNQTGGSYSAIPGGKDNITDGLYSLAAGHEAEALHDGSFVWADATGGPFASTADDQFRIRATGGVEIVGASTISPVAHLRVNGSISIFNDLNGNLNGNTSLFFGQENVTPTTLGEWGIQYLPTSLGGGGLNFWKPSGSGGNGFGNYHLFLSDNHNVGIRTASPQTPLHIGGDNFARPAFPVYIAPTNANGLGTDPHLQGLLFNAYTMGLDRRYGDIVSLGYSNTNNNFGGSVIRFLTNDQFDPNGVAVERMRIDRNGNVGIGTGTAVPTQRLVVCGNVNVDGNIEATGSITGSAGFACPSDARFKLNVSTVENGLGLVMHLRGVRYDWDRERFPDRGFTDTRQLGFIAQEIKDVVPELVMEMSDGYYAVDYSRLAPVLVEAIKELKLKTDRIDELEQKIAEIDQLKSQLSEMSGQVSKLLAAQSTSSDRIKLVANDQGGQTGGK